MSAAPLKLGAVYGQSDAVVVLPRFYERGPIEAAK